MPSTSKKQQRLMGMVHAYQKGELKNASPEIKKIAKNIDYDDAKHFAETKHKGLPEKVKKKKSKKKYESTIITFSDFLNEEKKIYFQCSNCGFDGKESKFVSVFSDKKRCPKCGCTIINLI
jgi:hypothetical protein